MNILKVVLDWFKPVEVEGIIVATAKALKKSVKQCIKLQPQLTEAEILARIMKDYDNGN